MVQCNQVENLDKNFQGHRYYKSKDDPQICLRVHKDEFTFMSTQTDNILGVSFTHQEKTFTKEQLRISYKIKDLDKAQLILGMRIDRNPTSGDILQKVYSERMLDCFNMLNCFSVLTLLLLGLTLLIDDCSIVLLEIEEIKNTLYYEVLRSLMQLQVITRPDLSYIVNILYYFAYNLGK